MVEGFKVHAGVLLSSFMPSNRLMAALNKVVLTMSSTVVLLIDDCKIINWFRSSTAIKIYRKITDDSKPVLKYCQSAVRKAVLKPAAARHQSQTPWELPLLANAREPSPVLGTVGAKP